MTRPVRHQAYQRPRRPYFKPRLELLEDRLALAGTPVNFAVIGDYGVASSLLNLPNVILGVPDAEGDVARLVHSWNNDFVVTLGDNNYLVGEQNDANVIQAIELLMDVNKISPATGQVLLDTLANIPFVATTVDGGNTTNLSTTVTFPAGTDLSALAVNMYVVGPGIRAASTALPFFTQISAIDDAADTITLTIPADGTFTNEDFHFLPADLSLTTLDGLSHIDRNIGRYYSDYLFPYSTTSPGGTGQFGNGSPTGSNRFFPVPGNHDWADVFSNNVFADSEPFAVLAGITGFQLDAYLNFFGPALTAQNSPGFKIGTTLNSANQEVPLAQPYYYSFTAGQTSAGRPLVEFFAFDSELADPLLTNTFTGTDFSQFTNVNTLTSQEGLWLQRAMASSTALWKIPYFHHTPYTSSGEDGEEGFNGSWMQLPFQQMGASAVLYGHVHNYERLAKADPAIPALNVPAGTKAIPYLLNGFGGASPSPFFGPNDPGSQLRYNGDFGAQKVYADQNRITFQFYNRHGGLIDTYTISQPMTAVAAGAGSAPRVKLINAATGETVLNFLAYEPGFRGGVRVAMGDVNGDGAPDIITAPGPGRPTLVRVFDGVTGRLISQFLPYGPAIRGGAFVAVGNVNGTGPEEIVVGPNVGALPVRAFTGAGSALAGFTPFLPYGASFVSGVHVAVGDTNGAGPEEIVTAPGAGVASVKVYNTAGVAQLAIDAYGPAWRFGAFVAAADLDGDGKAELIVSPGGGTQQVRLFNGQTGVAFNQFFPFGPGQAGPVVVAAVDLDLDGKPDILAARGRGGPSVVRLFNGRTLGILKAFPAFPGSLDGVFLAGA